MIIDNSLLEMDVIKSFMKKYKFPKGLKINLIVTTNIEEEYKKQMKRLNRKYDYISPIDYNGLVCVPNTIEEETIIIINHDRVIDHKDNNCEVICTIFHELVHAKDYYNYYKRHLDGEYDSSENRDSQYGFLNWSEFNAKRISYYESCKLIYADKFGAKENLEEIIKHELPNKNKEIEEYLTDKNIGVEEIIYNIMFYLGRYSVWEELFPNEFGNNKKFPEELLKYKPYIDELYNTLKENNGNNEEYIEIKRLINFIKGTWVNISNNN